MRDTVLAASWRMADQLMAQYRASTAEPQELFDLKRMAKFYALTDLFAAYHAMIWHNRRFYFDPIAQRLQPVGFDAFSGEVNDRYIDTPIWGMAVDGWNFAGGYHDQLSDFFFRDHDFLRAYYSSLKQYSAPRYLDHLIFRFQEDLKEREAFLRNEYWGYAFDVKPLQRQAAAIQKCLEESPQAAQVHLNVRRWTDGSLWLEAVNANAVPIALEVKDSMGTHVAVLAAQVDADIPCREYFRYTPAMQIWYGLPGCVAKGELLLGKLDSSQFLLVDQ